MSQTPRVFLDTSVIFAGIWSPTGGSRQILKLGQSRTIQLFISQHVLDEIQDVLVRKAPDRSGGNLSEYINLSCYLCIERRILPLRTQSSQRFFRISVTIQFYEQSSGFTR